MNRGLMLVLSLVLTILLAACGQSNETGGTNSTPPAKTEVSKAPDAATEAPSQAPSEEPATKLSGNIVSVGSSALMPLVEAAGQKFMDKHSEVNVLVQAGGSGTGLAQISEGAVDIGNSDVFAEEKLDADKASKLKDHAVAVVAMATVAHKEVGVDSLTKQQLVDIFTGKVTNWSEVGGIDQAIQIINRPSSSGTRATFETYALGQKTEDLPGSQQEDSSGNIQKMVKETPGAIAYLALSYLEDSFKVLAYDGVEPTEENIVTGKYPLWAYQHMYTNGEPNEVVQAFLDFMLSDEIQENDVRAMKYIPTSAMKIVRSVDGTISPK